MFHREFNHLPYIPYAWYLLKCLYFLMSCYILHYGYPVRTNKTGFTYRYSIFRGLLYKVYAITVIYRFHSARFILCNIFFNVGNIFTLLLIYTYFKFKCCFRGFRYYTRIFVRLIFIYCTDNLLLENR